jgi:hypothetical protein
MIMLSAIPVSAENDAWASSAAIESVISPL